MRFLPGYVNELISQSVNYISIKGTISTELLS